MITLQITVVDKVATYHKRGGHIVCGNSDYQIAFNFDAEWDGYTTKTARFISNGEHYDKVFSGNICPVPVLRDTDKVEVGVFVEGLETTTRAEISCRRSILCGGSTPSIENDMDYANEAKEAAERAAEAARVESEKLISELGVVQTLSQHDKRISNLERASGVDSFETDASVAYTKDVPVNALTFAEVNKVGGMTYKDGDILRSAPVTEVESVGKNLFNRKNLKPLYSNATSGYTLTSTDNGIKIKFAQSGNLALFLDLGSITPYLGKILTLSIGENQNLPIYESTTLITLKPDGTGRLQLNDGLQGSTYVACTIPNSYTDERRLGIRFYVNNAEKDVEYEFPNVQVEISDIATEYSPYTKTSFPIPEAVQSLDGYGWGINESVYNYVDRENRQFVKRVEKLIFDGTEAWDYAYRRFAVSISKPAAQYTNKCLCDKYEYNQNVYKDSNQEPGVVAHTSRVYIRDAGYTSLSDWKAQLASNPVTIYYELEEPIITDISDILPDDNYIEVEGGGTLTFENEHKLAVPSEITYQIKEVTA